MKLLLFILLFKTDTVKVVMLTSDTCTNLNAVEWKLGYAVRELHNTIEATTPLVVCCNDYWKEVEYLDELKRPLSKSVIVWQTVQTNWNKKHFIPT